MVTAQPSITAPAMRWSATTSALRDRSRLIVRSSVSRPRGGAMAQRRSEPSGTLSPPPGSPPQASADQPVGQMTAGFHIANVPAALCFHAQTCSE
jgi:hypothetical protein